MNLIVTEKYAELRTKFVPFAMDTEHKEFIVFRTDASHGLSLFLWVYLYEPDNGRQIKFSAITELMNYTRWTGEAMDVCGEFPEDILQKAAVIGKKYSTADILDEFRKYQRFIKKARVQILREWEDEIMGNLIIAKEQYNGRMYMY